MRKFSLNEVDPGSTLSFGLFFAARSIMDR
jgi:hypothetical protein